MRKKYKREKSDPDPGTFICRRCGRCCQGSGVVRVDSAEAKQIARFLDITVKSFYRRYTLRGPGDVLWLIDHPNPTQDCIFLERVIDGIYRCRIHPVKPAQCRRFPRRWRSRELVELCAGLQEDHPVSPSGGNNE